MDLIIKRLRYGESEIIKVSPHIKIKMTAIEDGIVIEEIADYGLDFLGFFTYKTLSKQNNLQNFFESELECLKL